MRSMWNITYFYLAACFLTVVLSCVTKTIKVPITVKGETVRSKDNLWVQNEMFGNLGIEDDLDVNQTPYIRIEIVARNDAEVASVRHQVSRTPDGFLKARVYNVGKPGFSELCPLGASLTVHVPEGYILKDSRLYMHNSKDFLHREWVKLPVGDRIRIYKYSKDVSDAKRDRCGERIIDQCDYCTAATGNCYCPPGFARVSRYPHLCTRSSFADSNKGRWDSGGAFLRGYDVVNGTQPFMNIFRFNDYDTTRYVHVNRNGVQLSMAPPTSLNVYKISKCVIKETHKEEEVTSFQSLRKELRSTLKLDGNKIINSLGPKNCAKDNGGCPPTFNCISDRLLDTGACVCPVNLYATKDSTACYDAKRGVDCTDGYKGGCEQKCEPQEKPLPGKPGKFFQVMSCGCNKGYRSKADGRTCEFVHACNKLKYGGCNPKLIKNWGTCVTNLTSGGDERTCSCSPDCCRNIEVCKTDTSSAGSCDASGPCVRKAEVTCNVAGSKGQCYVIPTKVFQTFRHGFDWKSQSLMTHGGIFQLTYSDNYDFAPFVIPDEISAIEGSESGGCGYRLTKLSSSESSMSHLEYASDSTKGHSIGVKVSASVQKGPLSVGGSLGVTASWSNSKEEQKRQKYSKSGQTMSTTAEVVNEAYVVNWKNGKKKLLPHFTEKIAALRMNSPRSDYLKIINKYGTHYFEEVIYGYKSKYTLYVSNSQTYHDLQNYFKKSSTFNLGVDAEVNVCKGKCDSGGDDKPAEKPEKAGDKKDAAPDAKPASKNFGKAGIALSYGYNTAKSSSRKSGVEQSFSNGKVTTEWSEKGQCPGACDYCQGDDSADTLAIVRTPIFSPIENLISDKLIKWQMTQHRLSYIWCGGQGDVLDGKSCACDSNFPNCAPVVTPTVTAYTQTASSITIEWKNSQQLIGTNIVDYEFAYVEKAKFSGTVNPFTENAGSTKAFSRSSDFESGTPNKISCGWQSKAYRGPMTDISLGLFRVTLECLKPNTKYRIGLRSFDGSGRLSTPSFVDAITDCEVVTKSQAEALVRNSRSRKRCGWWGRCYDKNANMNKLRGASPLKLALAKHYYEERAGSGKWNDYLDDVVGGTNKGVINGIIDRNPTRCQLYASPNKYQVKDKYRKLSTCDFTIIDTSDGFRENEIVALDNFCSEFQNSVQVYQSVQGK